MLVCRSWGGGAATPAGIVRAVTRSACKGRTRSWPGASRPAPTLLAMVAALLLVSSASATGAEQAPPGAPGTPPAESPPSTAVGGTAPVGTEPSSPASASFLIEKIVVTGVRHGSEGVVATETLLRPGSPYTEAQLREALHRVERLPFVVSADFSLRRGSERGRFELVITVVETKPVFFGGALGLGAFGDGGEIEWAVMASPEIGARTFFGQSGELTGTISGIGAASSGSTYSEALFNVAIRHHDLFGRRLVGTLFAGVPQPDERHAGAELAVPLTRTSVLTFGLRQTRKRSDFEDDSPEWSWFRSTRGTSTRADAAWRRDTTDDPFAPRQGGRLQVQGSLSAGDTRVSSSHDPWSDWYSGPAEGGWTEEADTRRAEGSLAVRHYWPLASRLAIGAGASLAGFRDHEDGTVFQDGVATRDFTWRESSVSGTAEIELLGELRGNRCGTDQCWWSLKTVLTGTETRWRWDPPRQSGYAAPTTFGGNDFSSAALTTSVAIAIRGRWGTVRLELSYLHQLRSRFEMR